MGIAVIGGMVFSTIITMLIVPAVYAAMDKSGSLRQEKDPQQTIQIHGRL